MYHVKAQLNTGEVHNFAVAAFAEVPQEDGSLIVQLIPTRFADGGGLPDRLIHLGYGRDQFAAVQVKLNGGIVETYQLKPQEQTAPQEPPANGAVHTEKPETPVEPA